jgi:outer membrane protein
MKRVFLFAIISIFIFPFVLRAEEIPLTLDQAVSFALRDNRDILLKEEDVKKAKLKIAEAEAGLFPTLNFTGSWTETRGYYAKDLAQATTQATLKQYLYKGGETVNTIKYNGYKFEVSQAILDKTKLDTLLSVEKAFYTLLLAKELTRLNQAIVENTQEHRDFIKERYKSGQAPESEVLQLESSLSTVQQAYEASVNQVESSQVLLANLLYLDKDVKINPAAEFIYEPKEVAFDGAFLKAMQARPEIKQYEAQSRADKANIEIAKADNRPQIYASWDYYSRSHTAATTTRGWNDYNVVGLTFSWPIFDGWATKAKVEQAIVDLKSTQLLKEKTINDVALELKDAYISLKNAIAKIDSVEAEARVYQDNLLSVKEKSEKGIASFLDLDDANLKYDISAFNKKQVIYDYLLAKASFEKAQGGL